MKMSFAKKRFLIFVGSLVVLLPAVYKMRILAAAASAPATVAKSQSDDAGKVCEVSSPTAFFSVPHVSGPGALNTDPKSALWKHAATTWISRDCTHQIDYQKIRTEVRAFWTDTDLYLLFVSPYTELNLWLPADNSKDRLKLWDRDVVEFFLGDDWVNIKHYREFEIAPTGDWVDLAIDLDKPNNEGEGAAWNSGFEKQGRIDEKNHIWYAAARVPLKSVSEKPVVAGTKWRANLYRIDGLGADPQRRFMCWQVTCAPGRDPNHVPEHFGTLIFEK
jgi:hypothetical protein